MKSLYDALGINLQWHRPDPPRKTYELRNNDEVFATLRYAGVFVPKVVAEAIDTYLFFRPHGFFQNTIVVSSGRSRAELGSVKRESKQEDILTLVNDQQFRWTTITPRQDSWAWLDSTSHVLLRLVQGGRVELTSHGIAHPELPLLVTLGWHLYLRRQ